MHWVIIKPHSLTPLKPPASPPIVVVAVGVELDVQDVRVAGTGGRQLGFPYLVILSELRSNLCPVTIHDLNIVIWICVEVGPGKTDGLALWNLDCLVSIVANKVGIRSRPSSRCQNKTLWPDFPISDYSCSDTLRMINKGKSSIALTPL